MEVLIPTLLLTTIVAIMLMTLFKGNLFKGKKGQMLLYLFALVGFILLAVLVINKFASSTTGLRITSPLEITPPAGTRTDLTLSLVDGVCMVDGLPCPIEDGTCKLSSVDKYDNSIDIDGNHKYKLNDGVTQTVANKGTFNCDPCDKLEVLWNYGNDTAYNVIKTYTVPCKGTPNIFYKETLRNSTSAAIQCYNEEGNVINDIEENETIGTGESPTLKCEIRGTSKRGQTYGGTLTAEINKTLYKENEFTMTGFINQRTTTPGAFAVSNTGYAAKTWIVPPLEGPIVEIFYVYIPTEDDQNPNQGDIPLYYHDIDAFEEEDILGSPFKVGVEDLDNSFQGMFGLTDTIQVD